MFLQKLADFADLTQEELTKDYNQYLETRTKFIDQLRERVNKIGSTKLSRKFKMSGSYFNNMLKKQNPTYEKLLDLNKKITEVEQGKYQFTL